MNIIVLSPGIYNHAGRQSDNLGDCIIENAVRDVLQELFPNSRQRYYSTHTKLDDTQVANLADADLVVLGGSNLLGNDQLYLHHLRWFRQWRINLQQASRFQIVMLGVGWRRYEGRLRGKMRQIVQTVASPCRVHSVRDSYSLAKLQELGIKNVVNTACPTTWGLAGHVVVGDKADIVLTMLTDYRRAFAEDWKLLRLLQRSYREVVLWPQGSKDQWYLRRLGFGGSVRVLERSLDTLTDFLRSHACDYVGTRLHGGIACARAGCRALILAVDNRAAEMAKEIGLPCLPRGDWHRIEAWLYTPTYAPLNIPVDAIRSWKAQFSTA